MAYWIKTVAEMTGIPKNTLIAWERRHGVVKPKRASSGYRIYSEADIAILQRIKQLLDEGFRISDAARRVREENRADNRDVTEREVPTEIRVGLESTRQDLLKGLLAFDRDAVQRRYRALVGVPFATIVDDVILPIAQDVGDLWEVGTASVAQEHFVTAWCRDQILAMARTVQPTSSSAPLAICATPPGELHELGLLGAAYHLAARGYQLLYLGPNVPSEELLSLVADRRPAVVALSHVLPRDFDIVAYAHQIAAAMGETGQVLVGGRASEPYVDQSSARIRISG